MDRFQTLLQLAQKKQTCLGFGLVALLTAGGEQIFSTVVFKCPCSTWNLAYGTVFLLVPALVLLVLGYILNNKTWKFFTGLCKGKSKLCRFKNACTVVQVFLQISTTAVVAPVTWIAVALLNGSYLECAVTGANMTLFTEHLCLGKAAECLRDLYRFPCGKSSVPQTDREDVLATVRAFSQVLGWLVIASVTVLGLLFTCAAKCNSPVSYLQLKFWRSYVQKERDLLNSYSGEHAKQLAERNLKSFFQQTVPEPVVTPKSQAWEKISSLYSFSSSQQYYSTLHRYVETGLDSAHRMSVRSEEETPANPSVLSFVDDGKLAF